MPTAHCPLPTAHDCMLHHMLCLSEKKMCIHTQHTSQISHYVLDHLILSIIKLSCLHLLLVTHSSTIFTLYFFLLYYYFLYSSPLFALIFSGHLEFSMSLCRSIFSNIFCSVVTQWMGFFMCWLLLPNPQCILTIKICLI